MTLASLLGFQIINDVTGDVPVGHQHSEVFTDLNLILQWFDNHEDHAGWIISPVYEGDVESPIFIPPDKPSPNVYMPDEEYLT